MKEQCVKHGMKYEEASSRIAKLNPHSNPLYSNRDDLSISRLFAKVTEDKLKYNATAGLWDYYDGSKWTRDTGNMMVEKTMKVFINALIGYAINIEDSAYQSFIYRYGNRSGRKRLIEDARDFNYIEQESYDTNPYLLNCKNCVINLKTGEKMTHDPALLLSKIANVDYVPEAKSELFDQFMQEIMMANQSKIDYIQKALGSSLTGENLLEQAFLCYGSSTRNGKSTLLESIEYMLGDYGMNIEPETLAQKDRNSRNASGDIARLQGCRFLHMSEPPKRMKLDTALVKSLTGRDPVTARNLYEREFEFVPVFTLFINSNYLPVVTDATLFSSERIKVISFDRHFEPDEQDRKLKNKLKTDDNMSGILNWCLDGLRRFTEEGEMLCAPQSVIQATEEYREKSDKIASFIEDALIQVDGLNTSVKEAYHAFERWCQGNGYGIENKSNFTEELRSKGLFAKSGTINGHTVRNVIKNYTIGCEYLGDSPPEW